MPPWLAPLLFVQEDLRYSRQVSVQGVAEALHLPVQYPFVADEPAFFRDTHHIPHQMHPDMHQSRFYQPAWGNEPLPEKIKENRASPVLLFLPEKYTQWHDS